LSIPVGSSFITNDIVYVKGIAYDTAENTKLKYGCCWEPLLDEDEEVVIPGIGGRGPESLSRRELCQIIQARVEEIFNMVRVEIVRQTKLTQLSGNVVLTGGGAQLMGVVELAQKVFKTTAVRIGTPGNFGGKTDIYRTPEYATVIGLLLEGSESHRRIDTKRNNKYNGKEEPKSKSGGLSWLGNIFKEFF
jgi:cell division protein FtsA